MGNICDTEKEPERNTIIRELFDLYDKNGDFNLNSSEFAVLSDYLKNKQIITLNKEIEELAAEIERLTKLPSTEYVDTLTGGVEQLTPKNFSKLLSSATNEELNLLLQRAKISTFNDLKDELDM